jgi:hypothetical protein
VKDAAGSSGHIWWTGGTGGASSDVCYVTWTPTIPAEADYKVEVYIPAAFTDTYSANAVTSSATYKITHKSGTSNVLVNQDANKGTWVNLGTYRFVAGTSGKVYLGDAVAAGDNGEKVLFDAVRFTQTSVAFEVATTNVLCKGANDGTATVLSVPGTAPYTYTWSHDAGLSGNSAVNLAPGTYTVSVQNQELNTYSKTFEISEAAVALTLSTIAQNPTTVGGTNGSITANVTGGGTPYTYVWAHDAGNTTNSATNLGSGNYTVTVSDSYGCSIVENITLLEPECCTLLSANFSTGIPATWQNVVNSGGHASYVWKTNNPGARVPGGNFDANFAILDADDIYEDVGVGFANASLITRAIDCSGKTDVMLKFDHRFVYSTNTSTAKVEVSNNGSTWTTLQTWSAASAGAETLTYDISTYAANQPTVYIRWTYSEAIAYSNWWAIDNVEVYAPLSGIFTVKYDGSGDYGSLSDAINDLNHCGVGTGGVTFLLDAGVIFDEELPVITATGTATKPITFKTSNASLANPVVKSSGSTGTEAAFALAGGDYFTFEGIDILADGTTLEYGYYLYNISATNGAQHNTFKNCTITMNRNNQSSKAIYQRIQTGTIDPTSAEGANSFNQYQNITISNTYHGIDLLGYDVAASDPLYDDACEVRNCTISDFGLTGATAERASGILVWSQKNLIINQNTIHDGISATNTLGFY